jgi:hypothetical protein
MLLGLGVGALLMFYLDPSRGRRRRALVRDKVVRASNSAAGFVGDTRRDLGNRLRGLQARARRLRQTELVDDAVLTDRVRSVIGRHTTHARNITASVSDGEVTLTGLVSSAEAKRVARAVRSVPGVRAVANLIDTDAALNSSRMTVPMMLLVATGAAAATRAARAGRAHR